MSVKGDSNYCDKVKARAASDASILYSPAIQAQFVKFPSNNPADASAATGATYNGFQGRVVSVWSPLDFYKGFQVEQAAQEDCRQHQATLDAMAAIGQAADVGKLPALQQQVAYLRTHQSIWQRIVQDTSTRLKAGVITLTELMAVQEQAFALDRKLLQMEGQVDVLVAKDVPIASKDTAALAKAVEESSLKFERQANHVRSLEPWSISLTAGLIPPQGSVGIEWFGVAAIGFNFGEFSHVSNDSAYLRARTRELQNARYELRDQLKKFKEQVIAARVAASNEMLIIDAESKRLSSLRAVLYQTQASVAPAMINAIELQEMDLQSDWIYLQELRNQLSQWK